MKNLLALIFFCCLAGTSYGNWEDCDCEWDWTQDFICAEDSTGTVIPVPNECFAECLELTVVDNEDCDFDTGWEDPCIDCFDSDVDGDGICIAIVEDQDTLISWVPNECFADCWGYENYTVVDCESYVIEPEDDCDCEINPEDEPICVLTDTATGLTCPFPNLCFAECAGYTEEDIVEDGCEEWNLDSLFLDLDCDCEFTLDPEDFVCVEDGDGNVFPIFNECFAECLGYEIVDGDDCDFDFGGGDYEDPCADCDENDFNGEGICIEVTYDNEVYEEWVPSECWADCFGYTDYVVVECDTTIYEDPCAECDEDDFNGEGICIELTYDGEVYTEWVPSECWAECFGFSDFVVVECDTTIYEDPCAECDEEDFEGEGICIEITFGNDTFEEWVPSECWAECWGYTDFVVVECDTTVYEDPCAECDEEDFDGEGICIEITFDNETFTEWVPSECWAECFGFTDFVVVECDSTIFVDPWDDCDCEFDPAAEPVCVLTDVENNVVCPFPSLCFAECAGYSEDDVVDCDELGIFECLECLDEEIAPVCVEDSLGNIFPVPNQCFADCLGLTVLADEDCGDGFVPVGGDPTIIDQTTETFSSGSDGNGDESGFTYMKTTPTGAGTIVIGEIYPNPVNDELKIGIEASTQLNSFVRIMDTNGKLIRQLDVNLSKGSNLINVNVADLTPGLYYLNTQTNTSTNNYTFVKF